VYFAAARSGAIGDAVSVHCLSAAQWQSCRDHYDALPGIYNPGALTPEALLRTTDDTLRGIGFSRQKIAYLKDLATKVQDGTLQLAMLPMHSDAEVLHQLMGVKGIGRWTAEMFLIFALGRLDVFPVDDLGIRKAIQRAYGYKRLPAPVTMHRHARKWVPYRTIATWYLWRSLDGAVTPF
jgi:DNA-3-methyladenine glycosylase II